MRSYGYSNNFEPLGVFTCSYMPCGTKNLGLTMGFSPAAHTYHAIHTKCPPPGVLVLLVITTRLIVQSLQHSLFRGCVNGCLTVTPCLKHWGFSNCQFKTTATSCEHNCCDASKADTRKATGNHSNLVCMWRLWVEFLLLFVISQFSCAEQHKKKLKS